MVVLSLLGLLVSYSHAGNSVNCQDDLVFEGRKSLSTMAKYSIHQNIKDYLEDYWKDMEAVHMAATYFILQKVLADPRFQKDPRAYLARWGQIRNHLPIELPEDIARHFIETYYNDSHYQTALDDFQTDVIEANLRAYPGVSFVSDSWPAEDDEEWDGYIPIDVVLE